MGHKERQHRPEAAKDSRHQDRDGMRERAKFKDQNDEDQQHRHEQHLRQPQE